MFRSKIIKQFLRWLFFLIFLTLLGFLIPQKLRMPVEGATKKSYSHKSIWAYTVGNTGHAIRKQSQLHYTVKTIISYIHGGSTKA